MPIRLHAVRWGETNHPALTRYTHSHVHSNNKNVDLGLRFHYIFFWFFRFISRNNVGEKRRLAFLLFHGKSFVNSSVHLIFVLFLLSPSAVVIVEIAVCIYAEEKM